MSLNKLLCKHIDYGGKGYVTLWDVVKGVCSASLITLMAFTVTFVVGYMYFYGGALVFQSGMSYSDIIIGDDGPCVVMFGVINVFIILAVAVKVADKLASIRVATCERKDGD